MIAGRGALTVLIAAAVGVLLALIALPGVPPGESSGPVDRHTGARVATADALRRRIRGLGEAGAALGALRSLDPRSQALPGLAALERLLTEELATPRPSPRPVAPPPSTTRA